MPNFKFLGTSGMTKIDGHKHPQADNPIVSYEPDKVYIQCVDNKAMPLNEMLEVGAAVKVGTRLGIRGDFGIPVYSSVSGKIVAIEKKTSTICGRQVDHFVIENDKLYTTEQLEKLVDNPTKEDVVNKIKEGGIVGLGGAGFPTFIKYNTKPEVKIDTILVNAIECEPYLTTDYLEGSRCIEDLFYALPILVKVMNAKRAIIAIKENKPHLIEACTNALKNHPELKEIIEITLTPDRYPMGFERTLISYVLHRSYNVLPAECHVIVNNLQTLEAVGRLFRDGATISKKVITIAGDGVSNQTNVECPVGTLVDEIIKSTGGYALEDVKIVNGGPMCGRAVLTADFPTVLQSGGFTILSKYDIHAEPCWKCGKCVDHCPMGLQPVQIQMAINRGDVDRCYELDVLKCVECGMCSFVCPSHIDVTANMSKAKMMARMKFKPGQMTEAQESKEKIKKFITSLFSKKKNEKNEEVKK